MRFLVLVLCLVLSGCASTPARVALGCSALDIGTTAHGLNNGYNEMNPLWSKETLPLNAALSVGLVWGAEKYDAPDWSLWTYAGLRCAAGAWNAKTLLED